MTRPDIVLTLNSTRHLGWQSISLARSIERVAANFELKLSHKWADAEPPTIISGQPCTLHLGNELLLTGYSDTVAPAYDSQSHSLAVQGRSRPGDLVDCSLVGREFKNLSLLQIAQKLCAPFGITVSAVADVGAPFTVVRLATGQPIFDFLEQLARIRAVRLVSNAEGHLIITTAGTGYADTALTFGKNIKRAAGSFDVSQVFGDYFVTAQQDGVTLGATEQADANGTASDAHVTRYRPTAIELDGPGDIAACNRRAQWERNTRSGRSGTVTYTVAGWQQTEGGRTWVPNELVQVSDPWNRINGERLITETRLIKDMQGERTEITVMRPEAFKLIPLPEPKADDAGLSWEFVE